MTLSELGSLGELIGGVAVVISLLYLAAQIRHGSQIARLEAHRTLSHAMSSVLHEIAVDPGLYRLWNTMTDHPDRATDEDRERFGMLLYEIFTVFSDSDRFSRVHPDLKVRYQRYMDRFLVYQSVQDWWGRQGRHFPEPFAGLVNDRLSVIRSEKAALL